ncbi:hypothetical protein MVEG_11169 [Podila verticillata NRRL 6337]|uniref:RNI-like protein n=1 Tax=Podila verticillata NRRL 6337 TaxID=1069443 RepID=A0A086TMF5_9FUNG|nr:hypothetical protein MVEG_11169 [Podila verticillata NRRL 6337]
MKQLQQRALDQLAVLQSRVQAVLTQTYELHEYPIPRLFVVLPQDPSGWDTVNPFSNKFRLYFLCECGEHTKSINSKTKIPHHIHFAKHEEFFQQYGSYVLTILKMLKYGVTVAGIAMPAFSQLISPDVLGQSIVGLKLLQDTIVPGVDQVINSMDSEDARGIEGVTGQVDNKKAWEGADLRKLETFLKDKDGNKVLGNLYRTVTTKGGSFDENNGLVKFKLQSKVLSAQFYSGLGKARSVYELDINLDLEGTRNDLEALADALKASNVSILHLDLQRFRPSFSSKLRSTSARYDVLCRIMEHPDMRVIHIVLPSDFINLSIFPPTPPSHLRKLSFEMMPRMIGAKDVGLLSETLKTNSTLTSLDLHSNSIGDNGAAALSEALKTNSTLTTLDLRGNSIGDNGAQALGEALKTNSTLATLHLCSNSIGDKGAVALSEAIKINSTLTNLYLQHNSIGENGAVALSEALKANSTLTTLGLRGNSIGENGAAALSEALKANSTLTTLGLRENSIGDNGAVVLSEAIKTNSTLTTLYLQYNSIGENGTRALFEALKANSTLTTLDLEYISIGDEGAEALFDICDNPKLVVTIKVKAIINKKNETKKSSKISAS